MHDWKAHRQTTVNAPVRRPGPPAAGSPAVARGSLARGRADRWPGRPVARGSLARGGVGQLLARTEVERHRLTIGTGMAQVPAVDRKQDPAGVAYLHGHRVPEAPGAGA